MLWVFALIFQQMAAKHNNKQKSSELNEEKHFSLQIVKMLTKQHYI